MAMNINYALNVASFYDYNRDGNISTGFFGKELTFEKTAKARTDVNNDNKVSVYEFANSLARGEVYMTEGDQKVHSDPYNGASYHYFRAAGYDYNRDGYIDARGFSKELAFDSDAEKLTDFNKDGKITVHELAKSFSMGRVYVGSDLRIRSSYSPTPSPYYPSYGNSFSSPYGNSYGSSYGYGNYSTPYSNIAGGALFGGAVGYLVNGSQGAQNGAVVGGVIGAITDFFRGF